MSLGPTELIIILVIVILLFGVGRVGRIGGELGSAVANFRKGMEEGNKKDKPVEDANTAALAAELKVAELRAAELKAALRSSEETKV
ncbi:MAG: twin-arginine translocase TatA/TatE family subunit [Chloroflexota bacterium]